MPIETKNLLLIPCDTETLKLAIQGNEKLSKHLQVQVPENWTEFGPAALKYSLDKLSESKDQQNWWTYFPILKQENTLVGSGGYKGKPDSEGIVELGYEIAPEYRRRGLATELTIGLIKNAFEDDKVTAIIAHTLGEVNPSTKVLQKCGFEMVEEIEDPEEGLIWKWQLMKK